MKRWQITAAIALPMSMFLLQGGRAAAQGFNGLVSNTASNIIMSGRLLDAILGYWVQGNALTSAGQNLDNALALTAVNIVHFLAQLVTMF
jgi:hypothetical protein